MIAGLDYFLQRMRFMQRNRMSKQEIKEEYRQNEGDPAIKAKIRQIRQERARKRMMAAVPSATVVIMNPTHYAVALKYEIRQDGGAGLRRQGRRCAGVAHPRGGRGT